MRKLIEDISKRIDRDPVQMDLIVKMRPGCATSITHLGDHLPPLYHFPLFHEDLVQVGIPCRHAIPVFDMEGLPVTIVPA